MQDQSLYYYYNHQLYMKEARLHYFKNVRQRYVQSLASEGISLSLLCYTGGPLNIQAPKKQQKQCSPRKSNLSNYANSHVLGRGSSKSDYIPHYKNLKLEVEDKDKFYYNKMQLVRRDQLVKKSANGVYFTGKEIDKTRLAGTVVFQEDRNPQIPDKNYSKLPNFSPIFLNNVDEVGPLFV